MNKRSVVMIVDDDNSVRRAARRLIRSFGSLSIRFLRPRISWRPADWTRRRASSSTFTCPV